MRHRKIYKRQCLNKTPYDNEMVALIQAKVYTERLQEIVPITHYLCRWCRNWHVGHTPKGEE